MKNILYILGLIVLVSCEKQVKNFELSNYEPSIVINGLFNPDSIVKVHVSSSISSLDRENEIPVEGLSMQLYEDGDLISSLEPLGNNFYEASNIYPVPGKIYKIVANSSKLGRAICETSLPAKPDFEIVSTFYPYKTEIQGTDTFHFPVNEFSIQVNDPADEENYYMFSLLEYNKQYIWDENYNWPPLDSLYLFNFRHLTTKDRFIEVADNQSWIYKPSFDEDAWGNRFYFSDDLFNGKSHTFKFEEIYLSQTRYKVVLSAITKDYFELMKDLAIYTDDPFETLFIEKVSVYSNVENGLGLLGSVNNKIYDFDFTNTEYPQDKEKPHDQSQYDF